MKTSLTDTGYTIIKNYSKIMILNYIRSLIGRAVGKNTGQSLSWRLRTSSSIYPFEAKALKTWKIENYNQDLKCPLVYFGMYHKGDYDSLFAHLGPTAILWAGSDITVLKGHKWIQRMIRWKGSDHYCENEVEQVELKEMGIEAKVRPSFLEDVNDWPVSFKATTPLKVFMTGHPDREHEYGFTIVKLLAQKFPDIEFHIYGAKVGIGMENVIEHGKVPEEQFNREIREYHCGFRPNKHDGCSEIMVKSILMGQYPITRIQYDGVWNYKDAADLIRLFEFLKKKKEPNLTVRELWIKKLNNFPWNNNKR